ncbi:hypothetical protein PGTUg99_012715 [Puccinia graminis f. sp. tritici]|uniref:Uncharacterized protein n=1 Tax=Puccinia graminis f. sp. tritici TaxID=56615 RepID=A0A5B0S7I7_PUCGR|nr:hypothetical protein PGTUg99_012715 [Puccinia graminis f. sp. tritici]
MQDEDHPASALVNRYLELSAGQITPSESQNITQELSSWVQKEPQTHLLLVIQASRLGLTSESDTTRAHANRLLARLVHALIDYKSLSKTQGWFIVFPPALILPSYTDSIPVHPLHGSYSQSPRRILCRKAG